MVPFAKGKKTSTAISCLIAMLALLLAATAQPVSAAPIPVAGMADLTAAIASGTAVEIEITASFQVTALSDITAGKTVSITSGAGGPYVLTRAAGYSGNLFYCRSGASLTLSNIILDGNKSAQTGSAAVRNGGTLVIESGAVITNNGSTGSGGGIYNSGDLTMNGGEVTNCTARLQGGGIYNNTTSARFTLNDGLISGNQAGNEGSGVIINYGVMVMNGGKITGNFGCYAGGGLAADMGASVTMNAGEITNNSLRDTGADGGGGVANVDDSTFTMNGGIISGNDAKTGWGGGVWNYYGNAAFILNDGVISGNTAKYGGGVSNHEDTFDMFGGQVSGNTAEYGGGLFNYDAVMVVTAGIIGENTASAQGGGLYNYGEMSIRGDVVITGNSAGDGGGIYEDGKTLDIEDGALITGNTAAVNGGGIGVEYANLANITVGPQVVFADNRAANKYSRDPSDDALYDSHIHASAFSSPLTQGYNNWDIEYTNGKLLWFVTFVDGEDETVQVVEDGAEATEPIPLARDGLNFDNWFEDEELTREYLFPEVHEDTTVYAKWTEKPVHTVIFNPNGGTIGESEGFAEDGQPVLQPADPVREGYTFDGWYEDEALSTPYDFSQPVYTDRELFAKWTKNPDPEPRDDPPGSDPGTAGSDPGTTGSDPGTAGGVPHTADGSAPALLLSGLAACTSGAVLACAISRARRKEHSR